MTTSKQQEAIAIIGMGCRFPGAKNPSEFWQVIQTGVDTIKEVPRNRWDIDQYYDSNPDSPGKMNTCWGGFLEKVDEFEPSFFNISPREAERIDPQQRLLLEVVWEALENGGVIPETLSGSNTGVFIGLTNQDYHRLLYQEIDQLDAYYGTGTSASIAANRISYFLNLQGPSFTVDTACSSSLVAIHLACQSLHQKESNLAIAGGVNLILTPEQTITFSKSRMMSPDGRCKTFDAKANGYVRSEGCGVVILKRLEDALQQGDDIQAIIRGSAVNQDGLSQGLTAPNSLAQQRVIRQALHNAQIESDRISYVETHGTGTALGDPIEVKSLKAVLMGDRTADQPCWLGSVKTNIGHLEAAAGVAGLIKLVLCLQNQEIPPILHFNQLNPYISFKNTSFVIPTTSQTWIVNDQTRVAGISGFSFGGTNCHLIVEESPRVKGTGINNKNKTEIDRPVHILTLSAKTEDSLNELVKNYYNHLQSEGNLSLSDICFSANIGRSQFEHRLAIISQSREQLKEQLQVLQEEKKTSGYFAGKVLEETYPKIAFLFTGQGSQYIGMGQELYQKSPLFRQIIDQCDQILRNELDESLINIIYPEQGTQTRENTNLLNQTIYTQPALFTIEYALAKLWQSWGIEPSVVMGHSVGEYVAACLAGVFSLEDGLKLVAARGRLMQSLPEDGGMVAILATVEQVNQVINSYQNEVAIAAINGSDSLVISGKKEAIQSIIKTLESQGIKTKLLSVSHAFHSPLMEPILEDFRNIAGTISYSSPTIQIISNVTGKSITEEIMTPDYWVNHLRSPVQFLDSMQELLNKNYEVFLEIGSKPILLGMGRNIVEKMDNYSTNQTWLPSLRPGRSDWEQLLESLGQLFIKGSVIDWHKFDQDYQRNRVIIPTYPWVRSRYWIDKNNLNQRQKNKSITLPLSQRKNQSINTHKVVRLSNLRQQLEQNYQSSAFVQQLEKTFEAERLPKIINYLQQEIRTILGLNKTQIPPHTMGFFQMGMDSLMAVEFRNKLEATFSITLPTTLAFNYPNIEALSNYILEKINRRFKLEEKSHSNGQSAINKLEQLAQEIEAYPEEEIERLLIEKITTILEK
ncbi:Erythronolide synthase [Rippkaea orientalis PCC 8801]|uniref:Erythronolide synthase n=1 Tax=Rippkaea orientalis (strain PCC 8801 / RF-1) TaxID=41431 RepID=B7JWG0_RIPO1|nr:type I polyketide synthase [Rippkaea orientalis]ACK67005.1 Erythronolide synthase [Rippkaea orientalis PCC 8801]